MPPDRLRVNTVLGRHIEQRQETRDHLKLTPVWTRWWTRSPVVSDWRCFSAPIGVTMLRSGAKPLPVALLVS